MKVFLDINLFLLLMANLFVGFFKLAKRIKHFDSITESDWLLSWQLVLSFDIFSDQVNRVKKQKRLNTEGVIKLMERTNMNEVLDQQNQDKHQVFFYQ